MTFPLGYSAAIKIPSQNRWVVSFGGPDLTDVARRAWEYGEHYAMECGYDVACDVESYCIECGGDGKIASKRRHHAPVTCPACKGKAPKVTA